MPKKKEIAVAVAVPQAVKNVGRKGADAVVELAEEEKLSARVEEIDEELGEGLGEYDDPELVAPEAEDLATSEDAEDAEEDGPVDAGEEADELLSELGGAEGGSLMSTMFVDVKSINYGKFFKAPKFGDSARLKIAGRFTNGNKLEAKEWKALRRKKGGPSRDLSEDQIEKFTPVVMAKCVFVSMENVVVARGGERPVMIQGDSWEFSVESGAATLTRIMPVITKTTVRHKSIKYVWSIDEDGFVKDTLKNRLMLLRAFSPGAQDFIHRIACNDDNFRDPLNDDVLGN